MAPKGTDPELHVQRFDPQRAALDRVAAGSLALSSHSSHSQAGAENSVAIDLHLRQSDLADLIGASRVRVNQALHQLRRLGHIAVQGNRITLLDLDALRARCQ